MRPEPRVELAGLAPAVHGGAAPPGTLDFSTGISPLPPPPAVLEAIARADVRRYPDPVAAPLRARLAARHGVAEEAVVVGAGSVELIWALARAFAGPGRAGLVFAPCFGEYAQALAASGARVELCGSPEPPFAIDLDHARAALPRAEVAWLCRPGNPTLRVEPPGVVRALAAASPATLLVVDEAYLPMSDAEPIAPGPNVAVLRSLTKVLALAGLRLGYLVAAPEVARAVQRSLPPWNVGAPAQAAGLAALDVDTAAIRAELTRLRTKLAARLAHPAVTLEAEGGPFLLYRVPGRAAALCRRLAARGVCVRDCTSFGLPSHVRVGVRPDGEQSALARAWAEALT